MSQIQMSRLAAVAGALLSFWFSSPAFGFVLLSNRQVTLPVSPENPSIQFIWDGVAPAIEEKDKFRGGRYQDLSDTAFMQQLIQESMDMWNNVPGSFLEMTVAIGDAALDEEDNQFSIVVESNDNYSTAAFAKPFFEDNSSDITDCDISISDRSTPAKELAFTLVHELGHCIGLGHAHSNYGAIMGYSRASRNLSLGLDDMAGLIFLYPDPDYDADESKEMIGCGRVADRSKGMPMSPWVLLVMALLPPLFSIANRRYG